MTYLWRDIDAQWWQKVKAEAEKQDISVRALLQQLVERWLAE